MLHPMQLFLMTVAPSGMIILVICLSDIHRFLKREKKYRVKEIFKEKYLEYWKKEVKGRERLNDMEMERERDSYEVSTFLFVSFASLSIPFPSTYSFQSSHNPLCKSGPLQFGPVCKSADLLISHKYGPASLQRVRVLHDDLWEHCCVLRVFDMQLQDMCPAHMTGVISYTAIIIIYLVAKFWVLLSQQADLIVALLCKVGTWVTILLLFVPSTYLWLSR